MFARFRIIGRGAGWLPPYHHPRPAGGGRRLRPEAPVARRGDRRRGCPAGPEPRCLSREQRPWRCQLSRAAGDA